MPKTSIYPNPMPHYLYNVRRQRDQVQSNEMAHQFMTLYQIHSMIFFHLSPTWFSDLQVTKNCVSADQLIFQNWKLNFSITKSCRYELEAAVLNQEWLLYCTQSLYRLTIRIYKHFYPKNASLMKQYRRSWKTKNLAYGYPHQAGQMRI